MILWIEILVLRSVVETLIGGVVGKIWRSESVNRVDSTPDKASRENSISIVSTFLNCSRHELAWSVVNLISMLRAVATDDVVNFLEHVVWNANVAI